MIQSANLYMDDEKLLFTDLEALIVKFKKLRDRTTLGTKNHYFTVVITILEQSLAYYAYYILGK